MRSITLTILSLFAVVGTGGDNAAMQSDATPVASQYVSQSQTPPANASARELPAVSEPGRIVTLSAPLDETIARVLVREGQYVQAGDTLVEFQSEVIRATLKRAEALAASTGAIDEARATLEFAQENEARAKEAHDANATGMLELRSAIAERLRAEAQHNSALEQQQLTKLDADRLRAMIARYTVKAPFSGIVRTVMTEAGSTPAAADPLIELVSLDTLRVNMHVPAEMLASLSLGQTAQLHAHSPINTPIQARIDGIIPTIDPATRTVRCVFIIENQQSRLPSGFRVTLITPPSIAEAQDE